MNAPESSPVDRSRRRAPGHLSPWPIVVLWMLAMMPLARWGLPSRANDDLLFGGESPWPAERLHAAAALAERQRRAAGADTDLNPLARRDRLVDLTPDEAARGEILRRYRLFSRQPDEMITFMALQRMEPRRLDFDPRLYQYGGGFIYLIGAALGAGGALRLVTLTSDVGVYLERPELFADLYLLARLVVLAFGAVLLAGVWRLGRRAAGRSAGWLALLLVACTPVFISDVLEAKPHVPSACLAVWAVLAALDFRARGRSKDAWRLGWRAGYAFGLVLTGLVTAALWPVLLLARSGRRRVSRLALAAGLALAVYAVTNPYIVLNCFGKRAALESNFANSLAMYAGQMQRAGAGAVRVAELLVESCGPGLLVAGVSGLIWLLRRRPADTFLAAAPGLAMLFICVLLGAGKPAEYARFLILPVSLLCVAAGAGLAVLARGHRRWAWLAAGGVLLFMGTPRYIRAFALDATGQHESRRLAGLYLRSRVPAGQPIGVLQEPAPYSVPPLDFAHRKIVWLPPTEPEDLSVDALPPWLVYTADDEHVHAGAWWRRWYRPEMVFPASSTGLARITWANKPVFIFARRGAVEREAGP